MERVSTTTPLFVAPGAAAQHPLVVVGSDVEDVATFPLVHLPSHGLAEHEHTFEVGYS